MGSDSLFFFLLISISNRDRLPCAKSGNLNALQLSLQMIHFKGGREKLIFLAVTQMNSSPEVDCLRASFIYSWAANVNR